MLRSALLFVLLTVALTGCYRHRLRNAVEMQAMCPPRPPPSAAATLERTADSGVLTGELIRSYNGEPLASNSLASLVDSATGTLRRENFIGTALFRFDELPPGPYRLSVISVGFRRRTIAVNIRESGGVALRIPLDVIANDECPGFQRPIIRRPWWQWWYRP